MVRPIPMPIRISILDKQRPSENRSEISRAQTRSYIQVHDDLSLRIVQHFIQKLMIARLADFGAHFHHVDLDEIHAILAMEFQALLSVFLPIEKIVQRIRAEPQAKSQTVLLQGFDNRIKTIGKPRCIGLPEFWIRPE